MIHDWQATHTPGCGGGDSGVQGILDGSCEALLAGEEKACILPAAAAAAAGLACMLSANGDDGEEVTKNEGPAASYEGPEAS